MRNENFRVAIFFAKAAHAGQKYNGRPYSYHLNLVAREARKFTDSEKLIIACWLHDVLEDTDVSYKELKDSFGHNVSEIVYCVTDELGRNRKERKEKTYPKIFANPDAGFVKICDRIANMRECIKNDNVKLGKMYVDEHKEFCREAFNIMKIPVLLTTELDKVFEELKTKINHVH